MIPQLNNPVNNGLRHGVKCFGSILKIFSRLCRDYLAREQASLSHSLTWLSRSASFCMTTWCVQRPGRGSTASLIRRSSTRRGREKVSTTNRVSKQCREFLFAEFGVAEYFSQ